MNSTMDHLEPIRNKAVAINLHDQFTRYQVEKAGGENVWVCGISLF